MAGVGGQAPGILQELVKEWKDGTGKAHPGIYDENNEFSRRWAESYPTAVKECLKVIEPRKFRNALFESAKMLVPQGYVKFAPPCPKYDTLVLEDGTERKLGKSEQNALLQMELMKDEIASMVRIKTPTTGNITYQLPPDKRNKMHDDRAYAFVLACWELRNLREQETFGDGTVIDFSGMFVNHQGSEEMRPMRDAWLVSSLGTHTGNSHKSRSPFTGKSPFV